MTFSNPATASRLGDSSAPLDLLTEVELQIARRADEFARTLPSKSLLNLQCWLLAEAELLGQEVRGRAGSVPPRVP